MHGIWTPLASPGLVPRTLDQPKSIWQESRPAKPFWRRIQALVGIQSLEAEWEELWSG